MDPTTPSSANAPGARASAFGRSVASIWPLLLALACAALVVLPVAGVFASFLQADSSWPTLQHLAGTVMPRAAAETLILVALVAVGVMLLGASSAWLVAALDFPGRRIFEWALLLPLAMPGYIVAYAYTDFLQYAGPLQSALRETFGLGRDDYWFPDIRSLPAAALVFTLVLYPYVYLLARTAFLARTASMIEAARSLGLSPWKTWLAVNLPLARPAVAAGTLLALMETIADYGAASYFGLQTFTTAIYRAWFALGDRMAASQLAGVLLIAVLMITWIELRARGQARFFAAPNSARVAPRTRIVGARAAAAWLGCCLPIALGFVLPCLILIDLLLPAWHTLPWLRFTDWLANSVFIALCAAALAVLLVLAIAYTARLQPPGAAGGSVRAAARVMNLGYAVPGAVIAVGILVPLATLDNALDAWLKAAFGVGSGLLFTGTVAALLYAYLVRYFAVAWQPVDAGLARITPAMDASARSLGAGPFEVFRRVHLPLLAPSILAASLLVFVDAMKELPATLVLRPFNFDTLAVAAYQLAADERLGEAALPSLTIVLVGVLPVLLLSRAITRTSRPS